MGFFDIFKSSGKERPSPSDWLPQDAIENWVKDLPWEKLRVGFLGLSQEPKVWIPMIPDTNSMDGVFDYGNNNILIAGNIPEDHLKIINALMVGDIAVYKTAKTYAIHRIVDIGNDGLGRYYRFKGDNNAVKDPERVRVYNIDWISIGTIY